MKYHNIILVYNHTHSKFLFCRRKKRPYIGKLNFPGGKKEECESSLEAAYRELVEETGIKEDDISPLYHLMDFAYYDSDNLIQLYVGQLRYELDVIPEENGNQLEWVEIKGTDFRNQEIFVGDGNIWHCFLMAEKDWRE